MAEEAESGCFPSSNAAVTFRDQTAFRAAVEYGQRRSNAMPYANKLQSLKAVCSNIRGDHQPRNRLLNGLPDFTIQAYDPIQNVRRVNFLRRRPMLLAAQPDEKCLETEVRGLKEAMKIGPKIEHFEAPVFEPHEIALLKLPISNKGSLAKKLPSIQDLRSVQEQNQIDEQKQKLLRFRTRFPKVFIHEEYLRGVQENEGIRGEYVGVKTYNPRQELLDAAGHVERFVVDRTPLDELKFRSENLDYFHFPAGECPLRVFLDQGTTWLKTRVDHKPKWRKNDFLVKPQIQPFPSLEDNSFTRHRRPRRPYSRYLEKVADELKLGGPFDERDTRGRVGQASEGRKKKKKKPLRFRAARSCDDGTMTKSSFDFNSSSDEELAFSETY